MSAGMHHWDVTPGVIFRVEFAGISKTRLFFDRQRVKLGPQHHGRPGTVFQDRHNPGTANLLGDLIAKSAKRTRQFRSGLRFVRRELRMLMQISRDVSKLFEFVWLFHEKY